MRSKENKYFIKNNFLCFVFVSLLFILFQADHNLMPLLSSQANVLKFNTDLEQGVRLITFDKLSPNIIVFGYDGNIIKWNLDNITKINSVDLDRSDITCITQSDYAGVISVGFKNGDLTFIRLDDFSIIKTIKNITTSAVTFVEVSLDGNYFVTLTSDNTLRVYSFKEEALLKSLHNEKFTGYTPIVDMKKRIVVFFNTSKIYLYSLHSYEIIKEIHLHDNEVIYDIVFSKNAGKLIISGELGNIYTIDTNLTFKMEKVYQTDDSQWVTRIATDKFDNIAYVTDSNKIFYVDGKTKKSYLIDKSKKDIMNILIDKYGKYVAYSDFSHVYLLKVGF